MITHQREPYQIIFALIIAIWLILMILLRGISAAEVISSINIL